MITERMSLEEYREEVKTRIWTDEELKTVADDDHARRVYEANAKLQEEFGSLAVFLAFLRADRRGAVRMLKGRTAPAGEPTAPTDPKVKQEWDASPRLREEFGGNFQAYAAYLQADREGRVMIAGRT